MAEVAEQQRRLAYRAPATALAVNMHIYWTGVAADLRRMGDNSLEWLLLEAAGGEVFAAGHTETGNDLPVLLSTARAERTDGGYRFTGHEMFSSLTPVWTRLGAHAMDTSDPAAPKVVHGFMPRDTPGYGISETWDTLGMRATCSDDTYFDDALIPDRYIARIVPAGALDPFAGPFVGAIFANALLNFGAIYYGIAEMTLADEDRGHQAPLRRAGQTGRRSGVDLERRRRHVQRDRSARPSRAVTGDSPPWLRSDCTSH